MLAIESCPTKGFYDDYCAYCMRIWQTGIIRIKEKIGPKY